MFAIQIEHDRRLPTRWRASTRCRRERMSEKGVPCAARDSSLRPAQYHLVLPTLPALASGPGNPLTKPAALPPTSGHPTGGAPRGLPSGAPEPRCPAPEVIRRSPRRAPPPASTRAIGRLRPLRTGRPDGAAPPRAPTPVLSRGRRRWRAAVDGLRGRGTRTAKPRGTAP